MKLVIFWLLLLWVLAIRSPVYAQQDCLSSLNVDPAKSVTFLSIDNGTDKLATNMSCSAAESLREQMFRSGQFDARLFDDTNQLRAKLSSTRDALANANTKLQTAQDRASRELALKAVKTPLASGALAYSTVGCVLKRSTKACVAAVASLVALWESLSNLPPSDDLTKIATQAKNEIPGLQSTLEAFESQLDQNTVQQSKNKYNAMFVEMCSSVKQQCLKK
jgi:hypothetical protein